LSRGFSIGLFAETAHVQSISFARCTRLDIAISGLGACGLNSHHHHVLTGGSDLDRLLEILAERLLVGDDVVRRKKSKHRARIFTQQDECRESDRRRCIPPGRLSQHVFLFELWHLLDDLRPQIAVCDHPNVVLGSQLP
jgi:hypothetical protein